MTNGNEMTMLGSQRGGTVLGFIFGLVIGLGVAVGVALYITNAPVPFINKVKPAGDQINPAPGGQMQDPNKPLYPVAKAVDPNAKPDPANDPPKLIPIAPAEPPPTTATVATPDKTAAVAPDDGSRVLLQAGAFKSPEDADAMRARLALLGFEAKIFPRDQDGSTVYRVRLGPYASTDDVNRVRKTLSENNIDASPVKVR